MSSTPDPTQEIQITNSTEAPIAILTPTISDKAEDGTGIMVYGHNLELLRALDGATSIPVGLTKTFVLYQTYIDKKTGERKYVTDYQLIPSTVSKYSPAANLPVSWSDDDPPSYPPQTVTADLAKPLRDAATFIQTISAYPTSALATGYQKALDDAQNDASKQADGSAGSADAVAQGITGDVNAFFKSTKNFQDVTLDAVVLVQSYYDTFPCVWGELKTGTTTYYLYSSDGSATRFVGTVSLTTPSQLDVSVANAGYTCTFTPASNGTDTTTVNVDPAQAKNLTYSNGGLFVDDVNSDVPFVGVKGTFQVKSLFTTKPTDTIIIPVLTGTVGGSTVIGFNEPQLSSDPTAEFWDTLFHPKNSQQIFQSVMEIGGALMLLVFTGQTLFQIFKWAKSLVAQPATQDGVSSRIDELKQTIDSLTKALTDGTMIAPDSTGKALSIASEGRVAVSDNVAAGKLQSAFSAMKNNVRELTLFEDVMTQDQKDTLESVSGAVRDGVRALDEANQGDIGSVVQDQAGKLQSAQIDFTGLQTQLKRYIDDKTTATLDENSTLIKRVGQEMEDRVKERDNAESDDPDVSGDIDLFLD